MTISELADETGHSESYIVKQMQEAGMLRAKKSKDVSDQTINSSYEDELEDRGGDIYWDGRSSIDEEIRGMVNVINHDDDDEDDEEDECDEVDEGNDDENYAGEWNEKLTSFFKDEGHTDVFIEKASHSDSWKYFCEFNAKDDLRYIRDDAYSLMSDDEIKEDLQGCFPEASKEAIEYMSVNELDDFKWVRKLIELYDEAKEKANNHYTDGALVDAYISACTWPERILDFDDRLESYLKEYGPWKRCDTSDVYSWFDPDDPDCTTEEILLDYWRNVSWEDGYAPEVSYGVEDAECHSLLRIGEDNVYWSKSLSDEDENIKRAEEASRDENPSPEEPDDED